MCSGVAGKVSKVEYFDKNGVQFDENIPMIKHFSLDEPW